MTAKTIEEKYSELQEQHIRLLTDYVRLLEHSVPKVPYIQPYPAPVPWQPNTWPWGTLITSGSLNGTTCEAEPIWTVLNDGGVCISGVVKSTVPA